MKFKVKTILFIVIGLFVFFNYQNNSITINEIEFKNDNIPDSFKGYKILQISDLHNKEFGNSQAQNATGDQWKNNSRKNEGMQSKQKQYPAVDVTGDNCPPHRWRHERGGLLLRAADPGENRFPGGHRRVQLGRHVDPLLDG